MRKIFPGLTMLIAASFLLLSCGAPAANNSNKPANANNSTGSSPADTKAIEADIKKSITDYAASLAKNDIAAFEKTASDNYMMVGPDGATATKADRVASMKAGDTKYESVVYDEINVRVNAEGNGAVAISKATVKGTNMGKAVDGAFRVTHVWSKTKDGWKLASGQVTPIAAKADDKKADDKKADGAPPPPSPAK